MLVGHTEELNEWEGDTLRSSDRLGKELGTSHAQLVMEELVTSYLDDTRLNNQIRALLCTTVKSSMIYLDAYSKI